MLTDEEIDLLYGANCGDGGPTDVCEKFARAVEAAVLAKLAAAEMQEPVAWLFTEVESGFIDASTEEDLYSSDYWAKQPLYTRSTT